MVSPVTGIFTHESTDVWTLHFDNGDSLGVTGSHPIYSLDADGWVLASTLATGNQVLNKSGHAIVTSVNKQSGLQTVYNLEVRALHNFLVGESGVVVHNGCWSSKLQKYGKGAAAKFQKAIDHIWQGHNPLSKVSGKSYFKGTLDDQIKLKKYITEAPGKGTLISNDIIERTVDGVNRKYMTMVRDMGEKVGKNRNHTDDTNILTIVYDITNGNPVINNSFPGMP